MVWKVEVSVADMWWCQSAGNQSQSYKQNKPTYVTHGVLSSVPEAAGRVVALIMKIACGCVSEEIAYLSRITKVSNSVRLMSICRPPMKHSAEARRLSASKSQMPKCCLSEISAQPQLLKADQVLMHVPPILASGFESLTFRNCWRPPPLAN